MNQQPSICRITLHNISLENCEILQIKCADFDNAIFINNTVVQANLAQKDKEIETLKMQLSKNSEKKGK